MSTLYVVATPIGNLQDITFRAVKILLETKTIIAESASKSNNLLRYLRQKFPDVSSSPKQIISFTERDEMQKIPYILKVLEEENAALISEAGTPLISDPGFKLIREAIKRKIRIVPVPGPSSVTAALSVSGLPTNKFIFIGFLPKSVVKRRKELAKFRGCESTIILFESPHRILETLRIIKSLFGNIEIVVARELTKIHEEIIRGKVSNILIKFSEKKPRGEFVILFHP